MSYQVAEKKINILLTKSDEIYENAAAVIFQKYFQSNLTWLNKTQQKVLRRMKAEGAKIAESFSKIIEFYAAAADSDQKDAANNFMETGCIRLLYTILGQKKADELLEIKETDVDFEIMFYEYIENIKDEGYKRIATIFMSQCSQALVFDEEETPPRIYVEAKIDNEQITFQHDTGADVTVVPKNLWEKIGQPHLIFTGENFRSYTGKITVLGKCRVTVEINGIKKREWLYVTDEGSSLLGRNWMKDFNIKSE